VYEGLFTVFLFFNSLERGGVFIGQSVFFLNENEGRPVSMNGGGDSKRERELVINSVRMRERGGF
jgi:hypothetical protein